MGERQYSSIPSNALKELDAFCKEFISCTCCEDHEVATKLAKLSLFLCFRHEPGCSGSDDDLGLLREQFSHLCANTNPRLIIPATPIDFRFLSQKSDGSTFYIRKPNGDHGEYTDYDPWWRGDKGDHGNSLEFQVRFEPTMSIALGWIEPENINKYLGFILEEKISKKESNIKVLFR